MVAPLRVEAVEPVAGDAGGRVVLGPWITGRANDEHPYATTRTPGNLTKRQLIERLCEVRGPTSKTWVERRMREDGLPYHKVDPERRQSAVRFSWPRVQAWLEAYGHQIGG